jgi:hypothetical protein
MPSGFNGAERWWERKELRLHIIYELRSRMRAIDAFRGASVRAWTQGEFQALQMSRHGHWLIAESKVARNPFQTTARRSYP